MRITNNMLSGNMMKNLTAAQNRLDKVQNRMSTGQKISKPSDDPAGVQNALRYKSSIAAVEQWQKNTDEALSIMETTDSTLGDVSSMLQRVRELAVQGANGTLTADNRQSIAGEVDQLKQQIRIVGNMKMGTKDLFAFGGLKPGATQAIAEIDGQYVWQGEDAEDAQFPVGNGITMPVSINGKELFGSTFSVLDKVVANLTSGDTTALGQSMIELDEVMSTVTNKQAEMGAKVNRMTSIRDQLENTSYNLTEALSKILDADIAETIMDFKNQENVYKAALSVGAQIIQPSLVDFMR